MEGIMLPQEKNNMPRCNALWGQGAQLHKYQENISANMQNQMRNGLNKIYIFEGKEC